MSRIWRSYLQVEFYTEVLFREKSVRFIAISNGVDSTQQGTNEFAPFLNIMNEWYVRDTSRKIKSVLHAKGMEGKRLTSNAIYGYKKDPEDWILFENTQEPIMDEDTWHTVQRADTAKALQKKLSREQKRNNELNQLIKKIYEDNVTGRLTDKRFEMLLSDYEQEQADLETSIQNTQKEISDFEEDNTRIDKFLELVRKYTDFSELTTPMIHEFIDKIVVHEADKSAGERIQQIGIYLKYVGKLNVPMPELTPEQRKEEERRRKKRAWNRTYVKRKYEREKAERETAKQMKNGATA